jgi:hypothetical protein
LGNKKKAKCSIPPGQHKFSKGDEDIITDQINSPESLGTKVVETDGRITGRIPNGNSWKTIRVLRSNQDLGTLWDIRQALHFSKLEGDYISYIFGTISGRSRQLTKNQAGSIKGYKWLNPYNFLVCLIKISDIASQVDILPMQPDFATEIAKMSLPNGYMIVKCDPRVLSPDGILLPDGITLEDFMKRSPSYFPTGSTRELATKWGREW